MDARFWQRINIFAKRLKIRKANRWCLFSDSDNGFRSAPFGVYLHNNGAFRWQKRQFAVFVSKQSKVGDPSFDKAYVGR